MAAKTRELTAYGARKKEFLRRDFGDLEVQMGVRDVTSPIAVLGITDFGLRMVAPGAGFRGVTLYDVTLPLPWPT